MKKKSAKKKPPKRQPQNRRKTGSRKLRSGRDPSIGKATQFKPGESGNPGGRPKEKPVLEALRETLAAKPELLAEIASSALKQAKYNLGWFGEVRDMLDGKPDGGKPSGSADDPVNLSLNVTFKDPEQKGGR